MIVKMIRNAWATFTAPFRPRSPIPDWKTDLIDPAEKRRIAGANEQISQHVERLQREVSLIARDRGQE